MLRQAVKTCLKKQNRLTFSILQATIRRIQTLNRPICEQQLTSRKKGRKFYHYLWVQNFHATGIQSCTVKKEIYKVENKNFNEQRNKDLNEKRNSLKEVEANDDTEHVEELHDGIKENIEAQSQIFQQKKHVRSFDIENINESDSDEDSFEELLDSSDESSGKSLVPVQERELKRREGIKTKSLIDPKKIYKPKSVIRELVEKETGTMTSETAEFEASVLKYNLEQAEKGNLRITDVPKVRFPLLKNVAPIVNDTEVLKKMVDLGVSLHKVQKTGMIDHVLNMNFEKDVIPYIKFLRLETGVPEEKVGDVITRCPWIFQHDVHNLNVRVNYLKSKKFSKSQILKMIDIDPRFLLIPMEKIDAKLGFLQREFKLTGAEVRKAASDLSKLIIAKQIVIKESKFFLRKYLELTEAELKTLLLSCPEVYLKDTHQITRTFDYIHEVMQIPKDLIVKFGNALTVSHYTLDSRHRFLVKLGKAQYDPKLPNYISLNDVIVQDDGEFCKETAKTAVAEFNAFLRLI